MPDKTLRVVQTIASTRWDHGGTSRSVPAICDALVHAGVDNHLVVGVSADPTVQSNFPADLSRVHSASESTWIRQWGIPKMFAQHLARLSEGFHRPVIHDHGVWLASNHAVALFCQRHSMVRVVSPRGMLGTWAMNFGSSKKRLAWLAFQKKDLKSATAFHVTSQLELDEVRALGFKQPACVIPNAVTVPNDLPVRRSGDHRPDRQRTALFLSRIHPKKGLINLVHAWHHASVPANWRLSIVGPDENGHQFEVQREIDRLGLNQKISFDGEIEDGHKWAVYQSADLFVLPSFSENFGIVVAEAMVSGLPVIATTATPWQCLRDHQMGWWVAPEIDALANSLSQACTLSDQDRFNMGQRGSDYARREFTWRNAAEQMSDFYNSL
ncbi:glycosyltransferase [Rubripirellula reticaptiva]|uniref:D-inositol 3-phosphate glycosyltransferase n=1 Tax=Rubripirellula reticaptiva TaxID=2528013 RepID=A0A5C6F3W0_9BACT|nr:glycosyltransferase [Rubripirellula reticaptiva]TWU55210.1 D-inositol 3-phosphate glycosyltransferase [Rubripirellula reticaptiva]